MNLIMERKSVRRYTDKPVEEEKIKKLLTSAMQAPSAVNQQPWEFIVITDKDLLAKLSKTSGGAWPLEKAPLGIMPVLRKTDKAPVMAPQDLSAATQNILLEAVNQDLGAVWIGVYPREERITYIKEVMNIKSDVTPFCMIAIGYPDETKEVIKRYDETRVHYNKWED